MNKLKPAILGGLVVGLLSAIPIINYCCCIWGIGGGVLAGFIYIKSAPTPVRPGDGAVVGAIAGLIGAVIFFIIYVPINYFFSAATLEETLARSNVELPFTGLVLFILVGLLGGLLLIVLSVIGGLLSVPIFEKRKEAVPPMPPQQF